jgi:predicted metal-dependent phosphoesterase TrpH
MKADLHTHSTFSDGSESMEELIIKAKKKGLDAIAVTDHDTTAHLAYVPPDAGIYVVGGVEISAAHRGTSTRAHVLGYSLRYPAVVAALTTPILEARNRNTERQAELLMGLGFHIDMGKVARADGKYLYKQHVMDWLVSSGQILEMFGDFYQKTFKNGGICDFDITYADVFDAVRAIKEAGGCAVLAHPGQQQNLWLVPELVKAGLDGLELNHYANSEKDKESIRGCARQYGLFLTGGSDYHGRYERQYTEVGSLLSEESGATAVLCGLCG